MRSLKKSIYQTLWFLMMFIFTISLLRMPMFGDSEYGSNYSNVSIPDNDGWVYSSITISGAPSDATVTGFDAYFSCIHTYSGDLNIDINDENLARNYDFWQNEGGSADNPSRSVYGNSTFNGLPVNGTWKLWAQDTAYGDTGYIDAWWIRLYYESNDQTYSVYARIDNLVNGTDADGDGYYETFDFRIGVDGDVTPGSASIYARIQCNTTGQVWWSASSWTISGTVTDYHYFAFDETDFSGHISGNTDLDFTVEIWNSTKTTKLATDTSVYGEPVKADDFVPQFNVYGIISNLAYGTDADGDGYYETFDFYVGIDADAIGMSAAVYGRIICPTTGQSWWSSTSWGISGTETDYQYFAFDETDFEGHISGNTNLDFTVEIWDTTKSTLLATDTTVSGEPVKADDFVPIFNVYGIISNLAYGTDADGDGYYETFDFNVGIDADAVGMSAAVYGRIICPTTGQSWWSSTSWGISGTETDYQYFAFDETDFEGHISGNTNLDFTVEIWDTTKSTLLATDTTVSGEPVKADDFVPIFNVYGIISSLVYGADADGDGYYETFDFNVGIDADAVGMSAAVYGRIICPTTGQSWWSSTSWGISGTVTDYHYFAFDETYFEGNISSNTDLDFTVEIWDITKSTLLATDTTVSGEPVKADYVDLTPTRFRGDHFVNKTAKIGIPILLEAKLEEDQLFNYDIQGETVHFDIFYSGSWHEISDDGISGTSFVTDNNGIASVYYTAPKTLSPGDYLIRARYDGSGTYAPCESTKTLTVKKPKWLVMIYLCADNNLEAASVEDFYEEMWAARSNDEVSICVLYDRSPLDESVFGYSSSQPFGEQDWSTARYFRFCNNTLVFNEWGELNLGNQNVLQSFVDTATSQCSADHTALILWNHGSGWKITDYKVDKILRDKIQIFEQIAPIPSKLLQKEEIVKTEEDKDGYKAVCFDDTGDRLLVSEVRGVLDSLTNGGLNKIDILGYDACVMGMIEVAYDAAEYADYLVASEDNENSDGWEYHLILGQNAISGNTTPLLLGQTMVDESIQPTLGCWDLSEVNNRFNEIVGMSNRLNELIYDPDIRSMVSTARNNSRQFRAYSNGQLCYVDLRQLATEIANRTGDSTLMIAAQALSDGLVDSSFRVRWRSTLPDANTLGGLSIYFPVDTSDSEYTNYFQNNYLLFTSNPDQHWDEFLQLYFDDDNPNCFITAPNSWGWFSGDIVVSASASDSTSEILYVEFQYSVNGSNWYPLPGPDSPDGKDWYSLNGFALTFRTTSTPSHGTINDGTVWVRARSMDKAGNLSNWDVCDNEFGVDNTPPDLSGSSGNTADPLPGTYSALQSIGDALSGVLDNVVYPKFYFRWNNNIVDSSNYDIVTVGSWNGSFYEANINVTEDHIGDRIFWRVLGSDYVGNFGWSPVHDGGVIQSINFVTDTESTAVPEGGTTIFRVKLSRAPLSTVNAAVSWVSGDSDITVQSGNSLTFTTSNWNTYQLVTLAASEDGDAVNGSAAIRISAPGIPDKDITAHESDNDFINFETNTSSVTVPEGNTAAFQVRLTYQPTSTVNASVNWIGGDGDVTVQSGSSLTFTTSNWNIYQTVTLAASEDIDVVNGSATIRISASGIPNKDITAYEQENDTNSFLTDVLSLTVPEGSTGTFQVKLLYQPGSNVSVFVTNVSGDSDITVQSGSNLTFTPSNWNVYQTVTLEASEDGDVVNGSATIRISASGIPDKEITATEQDNDALVISGKIIDLQGAGILNVVLNGLPGNPVTDSQGNYSATVDYGWSGTVTPTLAGYTFTEPSTTYTNVTSNQTTNYTATLLTYTISGIVTAGGTGLINVLMSGLPGNPVTDSQGNYTATVDYGWSGTVTPTLAGYTFTEPSTTYSNVTSNQTTNYTAALSILTISGQVTSGGLGLENVVMDGLPENPSTNQEGNYTATVDYGWSGTVTPTLAGYTFTEPSTTYTNVTSNQTTNYTAVVIPVITVISPNGGEVWEAGTTQTISWQASGNISQVDVSILRPGDLSVFSQTFFSNPGSTTWVIPTDMSGIFFARVRITDSIGNQYEDTSNEYFNVVDPSTVDDPFAVPAIISNLSQTMGEVDMAVDPANNLHAAWSDNFNLFYRKKTGAGWETIEQLTTNNTVKTNGSNHVLIAADTSNRPHIIYKSTTDDLYYTYNNGTGFTLPVNLTNAGNIAWYRMATDTGNNIHLIYRDFSYQVHYRKISGGVIDASASETLWTTCGDTVGLAVASPDDIYAFRGCDGISYRRFNNSSWGASQTLTTTPGDEYPCAEVDSSGTVHLIWRTASGQNTGLWYATLNNEGVLSTPTLISTYLGLPKLTLDKNDFPVVSNRMSIGSNIHMTIIKKTNSGWLFKVVSTNSQSANEPGPVAVDSNNIIHVSYTGWDSGSMAVFYTSGSACGIDVFIISGTVTFGGSGLENVVINGLPGDPTTDSQGYYTEIVNCGWSGTATPTLTGYTFTEASTTYTNVTSNQTTNYTATLLGFTISGTVTFGGVGLQNVVMNGLPGNPVTDTQGNYNAEVDYGWSGTVTPTLAGYIFTEPSTTYTDVTANHTTNYTATLLIYTISGTVTSGGSGLENVVMNGLPGNPVTNAQGFYTAAVNYGWSGTVTPTLAGYAFTEPSTTYTNVTSNLITNYTATLIPNITVTSPNGGETLEAGSIHTITWTSTGTISNVTIEYSINNGASWRTIVSAIANSGSYNWTVPDSPSDNCLVLIRGSDSDGGPEDVSDEVFSIVSTTPPSLRVTSPNGGEKLTLGSLFEITWASNGPIGDIKIEYSIDNGNSWVIIVPSTGNDGSYTWTVPDTPSDSCLVRISESDKDDGVSDISDGGFFIVPAPFITITSPNGGETWEVGVPHHITWNSSEAIGNIKIEYSTNNGTSWTTIAASTDNSGSFNWTVPDNPSENCLIRISEAEGDSSDVSDGVFSIVLPPSITVTSPNGGENWPAGSKQDITWSCTGTIGNVKIEYSTDNGTNWKTTAESLDNNGSYNWTVPDNPSENCLIRISESDKDGGPSDISDAPFSITPAPVITITSPNGGEKLPAESTHEITWTSSQIQGEVKIEYSTDNGASWINIVLSTINDGSHSWTVPDNPSETCLIRISETDGEPSDVSDSLFSIVSTSTSTITVTSPNGGENLTVGEAHEITWTSTGMGEEDTVIIEYSTDNGTTWLNIVPSTVNTGNYNWTIPDNSSENCKIRIAGSDSDEGPSDTSDSVFSIVPPSTPTITVTSPNGGESLTADTAHEITWSSSGMENVENIIIEYSTDSGTTWTTVVFTTSDIEAYSWTVPDNPSDNCLIRIRVSDSDEGPSDVSDKLFSIVSASSITVISPNGGEKWKTGSTYNITWTSTGITGDVVIDLYSGGSFDLNIGTISVESGSFAWDIPGNFTFGDDYKILLHKDSTEDDSDDSFSIVEKEPNHPDFNNDGSVDILWRNYATGNNEVWLMNGSQHASSSSLPVMLDLNWRIVGTGDFNRDGKVDILWRNYTNGQNQVWYMDGTTQTGSEYLLNEPDSNWKIVETGDFNGDAKVDIVWRNALEGRNMVWYMDGVIRIGISALPKIEGQSWEIVGVGDFNGDHKVDILWRNDESGSNQVWYMDGVTRIGIADLIQETDLDWRVVGTGDFNLDGALDILWRRYSDGQNVIWYMSGVIRMGYESIETRSDLNWRIVSNGD